MKADIDKGHASIEEYFWWINERQQIWYNRNVLKLPKPWTQDKIMQRYKFTNCFRQLDRGTIALNELILKDWYTDTTPLAELDLDKAIDIMFNVIWYRMFNLDIHAHNLGRIHFKDYERLREYMHSRKLANQKCFTSAHMTSGSYLSDNVKCKVYSHLVTATMMATMEDGDYKCAKRYLGLIARNPTMEGTCQLLQELPLIGGFISYEIACDLRFTPILRNAKDKLTWANLGPGARRGLKRLGLVESVEGMRQLFALAPQYLSDVVKNAPVPFEMREIEHSLCEFDKYQRVKTGVGRPRETYNGEGFA